ncbi:MAG: TlpA disulfide reductase family protein [Ruthenibacterium sp.]
MHKLVLFAALALCSLSLAACGAQPAASQPNASQTQTASQSTASQTAGSGLFSSFSAVDLDGNAVDASVLTGKKLTMVNVWATYCGPCLREMPDLGALSTQYADKDVQVIGIVLDAFDGETSIPSQVEVAKEIIAQTGADYLHLTPSKEMFESTLRDVSAVPTTFFVDASGNVLGEPYLGARSAGEWQQMIDGLLADRN